MTGSVLLCLLLGLALCSEAFGTVAGGTSPLLGEKTVVLHESPLPAWRAEAFRMRTHASGVAGAVHIYTDSGSTARVMAVGIYGDAAGRIGSLVSRGVAPVRGRGWRTVPLISTRLEAGKTYWLVLLGEGGTLRYGSSRRSTCLSSASSRTPLRELPTRWRTGGWRSRTSCRISAYVASSADIGLDRLISSASTSPSPLAPDPPAVGERPLPEDATPASTLPPSIAGTAVVGHWLSASRGEWEGSPTSYTYQWQECDAWGEGCLGVAGATAPDYQVTASDLEGSLRVMVTATNSAGSTSASSSATPVITSGLSSPTNEEAPSISGAVSENQTLVASPGMWTGEPATYTYEWEDCSSLGDDCSVIAGATSNVYVVALADVGLTLRVVVKAGNLAGEGEATSAATGVVATDEKNGGTPANCFENPETEGTARIEACGYPGPHNTGMGQGGSKCSDLKSSGSITPDENATIENTDIIGTVTIAHSHVTLNNDCVIAGGSGGGGVAVNLECAAKNFTIENSTVRGEDATSKPIEVAIANDCRYGEEKLGVAKGDVFEGCGECVHGNWEVDESYIMANKEVQNGNPSSIHREDWYINGNPGAENGAEAIANDDTMFTPDSQTAIIFGDTNNGSGGTPCDNIMTVTNSFVAGSGQMFQTCKSKEAGTSKFLIKNDRFARCLTKPIVAELCTSPYKLAYAPGDSHGYFPLGGRYGVLGTEVPVTWEGNYWDDNLEAVAK